MCSSKSITVYSVNQKEITNQYQTSKELFLFFETLASKILNYFREKFSPKAYFRTNAEFWR